MHVLENRVHFQIVFNWFKKFHGYICKNTEDTQSHLLFCNSLENQNVLASSVPEYDHPFSSKVEDQVVIVLKNFFEERKKLLKNGS